METAPAPSFERDEDCDEHMMAMFFDETEDTESRTRHSKPTQQFTRSNQ